MTERASSSVAFVAGLCAGTMIAVQLASKAARDALFLGHFPVDLLPRMLVVAAVVSFVTVIGTMRLFSRFGPSNVVPAAFVGSAALFGVEYALSSSRGDIAALVLFLHVAAVGAILISGFWSVVNELFDPRTAKRAIARIAAGGTLGGVIGGLLATGGADWVGPRDLLPFLAGLHLLCAPMVGFLRGRALPGRKPAGTDPAGLRAGLGVLRRNGYLRSVAGLVFVGTVGAAVVDFVFKSRAVDTYGGSEDALLQFFAAYYTGIGVLTFAVQALLGRRTLERVGVSRTAAALPSASGVTILFAMVLPTLWTAAVARGAESVLRSSLFRAAYELLYVPVKAEDKRLAKTLIDVGFERMGDAAGGLLTTLLVALIGSHLLREEALLGVGLALSFVALYLVRRIGRGYVRTLEHSMLHRANEIDLPAPDPNVSQNTLLLTMGEFEFAPFLDDATGGAPASDEREAPADEVDEDPLVVAARELRSGDAVRVLGALERRRPIPTVLVGHVIPLLGWDRTAAAAMEALREVADETTGSLADALLDADTDFAVRRRIPRVLRVATRQRAVDALLEGLEDTRFEVRFQCGRALRHLHVTQPALRIPGEHVLATVEREVNVDGRVWRSQRLLDDLPADDDVAPFVDQYLRDRAARSLEHVFTMLALTFEEQPLQIAFRGLHTDDPRLRGTALEYLESVLPARIHRGLLPFIGEEQTGDRADRPREDVLESLIRSNQSIQMNLQAIRERFGK